MVILRFTRRERMKNWRKAGGMIVDIAYAVTGSEPATRTRRMYFVGYSSTDRAMQLFGT